MDLDPVTNTDTVTDTGETGLRGEYEEYILDKGRDTKKKTRTWALTRTRQDTKKKEKKKKKKDNIYEEN